ncbi:hypothetical protein J7M28_12215 [bacterium]|nr:hypothetical protein [bacterium]
MPIMLNTILLGAGLPLKDVRLLRHQDRRAKRGRTPYELWLYDRPKFELYQSIQKIPRRRSLNTSYWAVFVVNLKAETMFAGLYYAKYRELLKRDTPSPCIDDVDKAGDRDVFELTLQDTLSDLIGNLIIDWGPGKRAWVQYPDRQNKSIIELRRDV